VRGHAAPGFVCEEDPDGLELSTLDGRSFLTVNGIQTLSREYLNLLREVPALRAMGVSRFRLSPHTLDMVEVTKVFAGVVDGMLNLDEAAARLDAIKPDAPFANGFYYGKPGYTWTSASAH
jgi:O2-independent ubiquinone biosynthesis protein UbiV